MIVLREDIKIESVPEAYLKLHLLSYREVKPNSINLDNIFAMLPTVAWTSEGPKDPDELPEIIKDRKISGSQIHVYSLDKFPNLTDYVIPEGVRIADSSRVRLGAYVGEGTTIMHEGQINFNAGTLGKGMVEGRIAQGVIVDEGSDIGGGASTLGTLSGGNDLVISVGKDCLLGANSGLGISLGDRCIIESGLYLTSASKVEIIDDNNQVLKTVKAEELSLKPDLLFIRNSLTGSIQCKERKKDVNLNEDLHSNN
jgi:2,3,4,5-tetrahydropyridine-2-carboxylate N-succinyltransferase